jgi:membrane protein
MTSSSEPGWVSRMQTRVDRVTEGARALVERVPVLGRLVAELSRVEVIDRSLAIGAQALLALLPMLLVLASLTPDGLDSALLNQVRGAMGLTNGDMSSVRLVTTDAAGDVAVQIGFVGVVVVFLSATSFSRSLQRMYSKVWDLTGVKKRGSIRSSVVWLAGWLVAVQLLGVVARSMGLLPWLDSASLLVRFVGQTAIWWWTARVMLLWRVPWSQLLPAAVLTSTGLLLLGIGSRVVMPHYAHSSVEQFGTLGLVFAIATWLVAFGGVLLITSLLGRLAAEQPQWQALVDRAGGWGARMNARRRGHPGTR